MSVSPIPRPMNKSHLTDLSMIQSQNTRSLKEIEADFHLMLALYGFKETDENEFHRDNYKIVIDRESHEVQLTTTPPEGSWNCPPQRVLYWGPIELASEYIRRFLPSNYWKSGGTET